MKTISRYIMTLALLITAVGGAWAGETVETTLWEGTYPNDGVEINSTTVSEFNAGDVLRVYVTIPDGGNFKIFYKGESNDWTETAIPSVGEQWPWINGGDTYMDVTFTEADITALTGMSIYIRKGDQSTITKVTLITPAPAAEPAIEVTTNAAEEGATFTEAWFNMPAYDATAEYELVRDMGVKMQAQVGDDPAKQPRYRVQWNDEKETFVPADMNMMQVLELFSVKDLIENNTKLDPQNYLVSIYAVDDEGNPTGKAMDFTNFTFAPGRYAVTASALLDAPYEGTTAPSNIFELFQGYEVTVGAGEYATFYKDENLYVEDADAELYTIASVTDTEAVLSDAITVAPANTPLLVYNKSEESKTFLLIPTTENADEVTVAKEFKGSLTEGEIPASSSTADYYALNGKAFVWVKYAIKIGANKCWLQIGDQPAAARANTRSITGGNGTTGIDAIENVTIDNEGWYDMQGRKLQAKPNRGGIYIHNGKKVVVH